MARHTRGYVAAIGGGAERSAHGSWSERPYRWIAERAGGRPVVVLSVFEETDFIPRYFERLGARRAFNLRLESRDAADEERAAGAIASAGAVFVKGGSQWDYVRLWRGTRAEAAMRELFASGGVLAGTSAGMHVLGGVVYDSRNGSVYPEEALRDAYDLRIDFTEDFLGAVPGAIFDSHFTERGRIARLAAFVARLEAQAADARAAGRAHAPAGSKPRDAAPHRPGVVGIGVDDETALLISPDGRAEVVGSGAVTVVRATSETRLRVEPGRAPAATHLACDSLTEGFVFDLDARRVAEAPASAATCHSREVRGPYLPGRIDGSSKRSARAGSVALSRAARDRDALHHGALREREGDGLFGGAAVVTRAYADEDCIENRVGGLVWLLARHPGMTGLLLDAEAAATLDAAGRLTFEEAEDGPASLVFDCRRVEHVDFSRRVTSPGSAGPRQSAALTNVTLHLLPGGWTYDDATGEVRER